MNGASPQLWSFQYSSKGKIMINKLIYLDPYDWRDEHPAIPLYNGTHGVTHHPAPWIFFPSFGAWLIPVPGKACREACSIMNLQMEGTRCWSKRLTRCFDCLVVCLYLCLFHNSTQHLLGILMFAPIFPTCLVSKINTWFCLGKLCFLLAVWFWGTQVWDMTYNSASNIFYFPWKSNDSFYPPLQW